MKRRFAYLYGLLCVLLITALVVGVIVLNWGHGQCKVHIRTTQWTAYSAERADDLAEGIMVLGIHAHPYKVRGNQDRAIGESPQGYVALRRIPGTDNYRALGLTASCDKGCAKVAAQQVQDRLKRFLK